MAEALVEDRLQRGVDKWLTDLFNHPPDLWGGEQTEPVGFPEKWETEASEQWMQRVSWNRMVTRPMREKSQTTPVTTTTWTTDFLTREGEDRKAMGD